MIMYLKVQDAILTPLRTAYSLRSTSIDSKSIIRGEFDSSKMESRVLARLHVLSTLSLLERYCLPSSAQTRASS